MGWCESLLWWLEWLAPAGFVLAGFFVMVPTDIDRSQGQNMRFLLKTLGVVAIATAVVIVWHLGTTMGPLDQNNAIQFCALDARAALEQRDTGNNNFPIKVHWGLAERLFRDVRATAHVSISGGPDVLIFCHTRDGDLLALMVDGDFLLRYGDTR